jgi:pimeloyl-ACP methyl ester carboxylesterase
MPAIRHHKITVEGLGVFVREAGDPAKPSIVLLPGYPSSTRAYVRLVDRLARDWHTVAIDYPGFGSSDPLPESPTFDRLAEITGKAIDQLGIGDYAIYMFDFGSPVGFRIALQHDQRVRAIITQNGNAYTDGFGPGVQALADWWQSARAWTPGRRPSTGSSASPAPSSSGRPAPAIPSTSTPNRRWPTKPSSTSPAAPGT